MYGIGKCYKCGHYVVFAPEQKTVLCRRCLKTLKCPKIQMETEVESLLHATEVIKALESDGKAIGFGDYSGREEA
jgi:hypothetical protein